MLVCNSPKTKEVVDPLELQSEATDVSSLPWVLGTELCTAGHYTLSLAELSILPSPHPKSSQAALTS